jgi:trehalose synthase
VPAEVDRALTRVILPAIDPHSPKNRDLDPAQVRTVLDGIGLTPRRGGRTPWPPRPAASRAGSPGSRGWNRTCRSRPGAPVVLQVSRWDTLKDMAGVLTALADEVAVVAGAHLVLQGPDPLAIADDPGGGEVFQRVQDQQARLPRGIRERVRLVATAGDTLRARRSWSMLCRDGRAW